MKKLMLTAAAVLATAAAFAGTPKDGYFQRRNPEENRFYHSRDDHRDRDYNEGYRDRRPARRERRENREEHREGRRHECYLWEQG
ncbi:MAG TPA: hypothetical protein VNE41_01665 [Chitinophagaceae bacterium]|nr:hypothetical protein [Chitinophagaceae bacterium]